MLNEDDIRKFYMLYFRYNPASPNIGVVGSHKRFLEICETVKRDYKNKKNVFIKLNAYKNKLTIIHDDIELSYIYIQDINSMRGRYFRKYM